MRLISTSISDCSLRLSKLKGMAGGDPEVPYRWSGEFRLDGEDVSDLLGFVEMEKLRGV